MDNVQQRVKALTETRAQVWEEAKGFLEDLKGDEMTAEQRTQWDAYNERIDTLGSEADSLLERHQRETEAAKVREAQTEAFGREPEERQERTNWNQRIRDWAAGREQMRYSDGEGNINGFRTNVTRVMKERELARQGATPDEIRALAWDTGDVASAVPTLFDRSLYEVLEENIAGLRMPTTRLVTESGASMEFPRVDSHAIATQVSGQGTALAGTDPGFDKLTLTPVKYAELIEVANEVISDNGVDIISFLARDLGRALGRRVNQAMMTATGGMTTSVTVGSGGTISTGGTLIDPTYEHLVNLLYSVNDSYRNNSAAWLFRDSTAGTIRKLRDGAGGTEGAPIWAPMVTTGISGQRQPDVLLGFPLYTDANVASLASNAKIGFFGDWSAFYSRFVGDPVVERNDSALFTTDEVAFRGKWRYAGGFQDLTAVNLLKRSV
jgi:HK97 family phage major capsid protein